ncbi:YbaN family protein [Cystobacter ferrugineus]|nr:YbaN family protein [Cystobacter ferrugineus]
MESHSPSVDEGRNRRFRSLFMALGFVCVGLGMLGAVLPLLPATPFLLIALWAFSRSSPRFHHWLYTHPHFGPRLQEWKQYGTVPVKVKASAISAMGVSFALMAFVMRVKWPVLAVSGSLMLIGAAYILSRPSRPPG